MKESEYAQHIKELGQMNRYSKILSASMISSTNQVFYSMDLSSALSSTMDLSVRYVTQEQFHGMINGDPKYAGYFEISTLYVISSDEINAYNTNIKNVADPIVDKDAANKRYVDDQIETTSSVIPLSVSQLTNDLGFVEWNKLDFNYVDQKIILSTEGFAGILSIDAADFIKDGMIDAASYDPASHNIIITFNSDAEKANPISIDVSDLVDTYTAGNGIAIVNNCINVDPDVVALCANYWTRNETSSAIEISSAISTKSSVYLSSISADQAIQGGLLDRLNIVKFDNIDTYNLCSQANPDLIGLSDLVLIDEQQLNAENSAIINVGDPINANDATNKQYVDDQISSKIDDKFGTLMSKISSNTAISTFMTHGIDVANISQALSALYQIINVLSSL